MSRKKVSFYLLLAINKKITGTQQHHKLIFHSSCYIQRILVVTTKVKQGTIRKGNKQILVITGDLITRTVTKRATICHQWWYLWLLYWIIQSSIDIICPWFVNSHPDLHISLLVITGALIVRTVTHRAMIYHHRWYLLLLHWMIK